MHKFTIWQERDSMPLADKVRPKHINEVFGQKHLIGKDKVLTKIIDSGNIPNMIFHGPPGVGKTTIANIIADVSDKKLYKLNATTASLKDIQEIIGDLNSLLTYKGVLLYLDEIQNFNKKQQQSLLSFLEDGRITLIASTTENPYFSIYKAILSRSLVFEFKPLNSSDIIEGLIRALEILKNEGKKIKYNKETLKYIAEISQGDIRKALSILEVAVNTDRRNEIILNGESIENLEQDNLKFGETDYYDWLSMLQKSIRGSSPDASVLSLAALLKAGRLEEVCRRLLVIASEDCGLAAGNSYATVFGLISAARMVGLPEAQIILSHAVVFMATLPKSNSACLAIFKAMEDIENKDIGEIPIYLKDAHYSGAEKLGIKGYKYPHDYPNHYVEQQYMPHNLKDRIYYVPGNNKYEKNIENYWKSIKGKE
jgi:putative ATPase